MYSLICQKPAHFLSTQMALVSTFFQMFIVCTWDVHITLSHTHTKRSCSNCVACARVTTGFMSNPPLWKVATHWNFTLSAYPCFLDSQRYDIELQLGFINSDLYKALFFCDTKNPFCFGIIQASGSPDIKLLLKLGL